MSKVAKSKSLEASAGGTVKLHLKQSQIPTPNSKVRADVTRRANDEAAPETSLKRKPTAEEDAMQELAVLRKQAKVDQRNKKRLENKIALLEKNGPQRHPNLNRDRATDPNPTKGGKPKPTPSKQKQRVGANKLVEAGDANTKQGDSNGRGKPKGKREQDRIHYSYSSRK
eukprot:scaffold23289_cov74-Cyclotella_meneghiniana.AAC.5